MQYGVDSLSELQRDLRARTNLQLVRITSQRQLLLDSEMRTADGYSMLPQALRQLSLRLASSLVSLIRNLRQTSKARHTHVPTVSIARIVNEVVRVRFPALTHHKLLLDVPNKRIVGVCGPETRLRTHSETLELCLQHASHLRFVGASLYGADMRLFFADTSVRFTTPEGRPRTYMTGVCVTARESNACFLRAASFVLRRGCFASPGGKPFLPRGAATLHNSDARIREELAKVLRNYRSNVPELNKQFARLTSTRWVPGTVANKNVERRFALLRSRLRSRMTIPVADAVLSRMLANANASADNAYLEKIRSEQPDSWNLVRSCYWYHLFEALLTVQVDTAASAELRQDIARTSYALLAGSRYITFSDWKDGTLK